MKRAREAAFWLLPTAVFVWLYWYGLRSWFQNDDFAWLAQGLSISTWKDWVSALFEPRAQGTVRVFSERLFFIVLEAVAGLDHRPFHLVVAGTMALNLALLQSIVLRLTRSRVAALAAALLWLSNAALATPLAWLSTYNEVLCAFFILAAFRLLLAGRWVWQAVVFVLGFGALEINVVYPALAIGYALLMEREKLRKALWLLPVSLLYVFVSFRFAPKPGEGVYAQHWDLSMVPSFWAHLKNALGGGWRRVPEWGPTTLAVVLGAALLAYAVWAWRRGDRLPAFGWLWFAIALGPVLPLRDHVMDYYVAIPSIGLALVMATGLAEAWRRPWVWRGGTAALLGAYVVLGMGASREITVWRWERGVRIRALVEGIERAHQLHPDQMILLSGLDTELFWSCLLDGASRVVGAPAVSMVPGAEAGIEAHPELGEMGEWLSSRGTTARALAHGRAVVYEFENNRLRNITRKYARTVPGTWLDERPREITVGSAVYERDLGAGWYPSEGTWRWMGQRAEVHLAGPARAGEQLYVLGYCPASQSDTPVELTVTVAGVRVARSAIPRRGDSFEFRFPLPAELVGRAEVLVELEASRTEAAPGGEGRRLGLAFGQIGLR